MVLSGSVEFEFGVRANNELFLVEADMRLRLYLKNGYSGSGLAVL